MKPTLMGALLALGLALDPAFGADTLKICAADDELPYANARGEGFEDRIADLIAREMGVTVERVGFTDPRFVVRDLIDKGKCDVMLGVDAGDPRLGTTQPYYRSTYVFVTRKDAGLDVRDWASPALKTARIGVIPGTPAEAMLVQIGRYPDSFSYLMALGGNKAPRNRYVKYDVEKLIRDVASGEIDVAVAWLPSAARYIRGARAGLKASVVPPAQKSNGEPVVFEYATAIGVRKADTALLKRIEAALAKAKPRIEQVLSDEGIAPPGQGQLPMAETIEEGKG